MNIIKNPEFPEITRKRNLREIIKYVDEIAGQWNGKESGNQEDRAHIANEISNMLEDVIELLDELEQIP